MPQTIVVAELVRSGFRFPLAPPLEKLGCINRQGSTFLRLIWTPVTMACRMESAIVAGLKEEGHLECPTRL
jgi:hypothetical protein